MSRDHGKILPRKIIHVDMDAFFASVEQRDDPKLKGKPVVVGGDSKRSVVAAASYEARKFGVFSAMPMSIAKQRCPALVIVPHRFGVYKEVSGQIREIFKSYTDLVEPLSLDEAYLDVTENKLQLDSATIIAKQIKARILATTKLTSTAGVSINKFLAKIASDMNKPDGLTVITPAKIPAFVKNLPIEKFYGVGAVTAKKMKSLGLQTGGDLQNLSQIELVNHFGKAGRYYYQVCRGIDEREVSPTRIRKSISVERTFEDDLTDLVQVKEVMQRLTNELTNSLDRLQIRGKTINLKWRYPDFTTYTRSRTIKHYTSDGSIIYDIVILLFTTDAVAEKGIRLLGVGVSNLDSEIEESSQLTFAW